MDETRIDFEVVVGAALPALFPDVATNVRPTDASTTYLSSHHHRQSTYSDKDTDLFSATAKMAIAPITGVLRRKLVVDLSLAMGFGLSGGHLWWYYYHVPAIRRRDAFYSKLEEQKAAAIAAQPN